MSQETIGVISGMIVALSVIPYGCRVYQRKITPNITTWGLWSIIGLTLLLTYRSSGAGANVWPAVFGFTNPCVITFLALWRRGEKASFSRLDRFCIGFCCLSLIGWWFLRADQKMVQFALYLSIIADGCAAVPTIIYLWKKPSADRPFAWISFALANCLVLFAIPERTFANYALPVWMLTASSLIIFPLVSYRMKYNVPLIEWI